MQITMELEAQTEPDSEPESEIVPATKKSRVAQIQAKAWTFHREWEFRIPGEEDVRKIAEFILEEDVRKSMPTALGVTYLVVLLNVFISTGTGLASTEMKGYIQCSKKVSDYALKKWFPENEGTNIFVVKGGLSGYSSYESDMKKTSPWMIYNLIGDLRLNNLGKRQVIKNFQIVFEIFLSIV